MFSRQSKCSLILMSISSPFLYTPCSERGVGQTPNCHLHIEGHLIIVTYLCGAWMHLKFKENWGGSKHRLKNSHPDLCFTTHQLWVQWFFQQIPTNTNKCPLWRRMFNLPFIEEGLLGPMSSLGKSLFVASVHHCLGMWPWEAMTHPPSSPTPQHVVDIP